MGTPITSPGITKRLYNVAINDVLINRYIIGDDRLNRLRSHKLQLDFKILDPTHIW